MTAAPATAWSDNMLLLYGNAGGQVQQLPAVTEVGGRARIQVGRIALASQASGTVFHIARVPLGALLTGIIIQASATLGSSTLAFGDYNSGTAYASAATYTTGFVKQAAAYNAMLYKQILTGYDAVTGAVSYTVPGQGGALYEDLLMTVGAAAFPSSGNLTIVTEYIID